MGASYGLIFQLLEHPRARRGGVRFDLGAMDPRRDAFGVSFFELGFGGTLREYLGEWEWARHRWVRLAMALAVRLR